MKINIKNINIKSICAILFIFLFLSCNNSGENAEVKEKLRTGQAVTADGTVIDLKLVGDKAKEVVAFVMSIEEIASLINSIDELAKGIGKQINSSGITTDGSNNNKNNGLMAGVYEIASVILTKITGLQVGESLKGKDLETKIETVKTKAGVFKTKLLAQYSTLGAGGGTQDSNAKQAIDRKAHGTDGTHGAKELNELHIAVIDLMNTAKEILSGTIKGIKEPDKEATIKAN
ncbi:hypothetical protein bcCo53_001358 (plasmid) [Borrelia coriaceae]|uniref:Variable outer membrane protein n=1 Tax=Borrelia coriaceae ATCC 43381 TaxID=1408429 RepID=W5SYA7_9SPIR|nr:Vsp/OspC family lipoprotein [Borrelia coriaceae]AHH11693.1 Variable outer membrane protein [Borrelia coriaceae ATCC 43381]UPA17182.1 hypothetical protein bcCo53_001358 [Borrelia coriaceae]